MTKQEAVKILRSGGVVYITTNNGSCQCGDTRGTMRVEDNALVLDSAGGEKWQEYSGPARECHTSYGFGATAREVALLFEQDKDEKIMHSFSQGTCLSLSR